MIKDFIRIANFLDKSGRTKDAEIIDYISLKYADGDLKEFFKKGLERDFFDSEFGKKAMKRRTHLLNLDKSLEEEETEELLKSLSKTLIEE
jgi:hypothetical protein